jgi:hypothetical protein
MEVAMDFNDKELKVLLQALYRFRGEVSGASQSEQNKLGLVTSIIDKIEGKVGPTRAEHTRFDEEMARSLSVLMTGRASSPGPKGGELDNEGASPKVKKGSSSRAASAKATTAGKGEKARGASTAAGASRARATGMSGPKKAGSGKTKS